MTDFLRAGLPEASRISGLLTELENTARAYAEAAPAETKAAQPKRQRKARPVRALPLNEILSWVNWRNDPAGARPLRLEELVPGGKRLRPAGTMPLTELFALINWTNTGPPKSWPAIEDTTEPAATPASIESVLAGIAWGE